MTFLLKKGLCLLQVSVSHWIFYLLCFIYMVHLLFWCVDYTRECVYGNILHRFETQHWFFLMLLHRCPSTVGTGQYNLLRDNSSSLSINTISSASLSHSCKHHETVSYSVMAVLVVVCIVLLVATVVLLRRLHLLRKRPRIKKRIIVNKNVTPLTACSPLPQDQCEITIENCCNMNICETVST